MGLQSRNKDAIQITLDDKKPSDPVVCVCARYSTKNNHFKVIVRSCVLYSFGWTSTERQQTEPCETAVKLERKVQLVSLATPS